MFEFRFARRAIPRRLLMQLASFFCVMLGSLHKARAMGHLMSGADWDS